MAINDGGQAFPVPAGNVSGDVWWSPEPGMSLRDYFAAQSIRGGADSICDQLDPTHHAGDDEIRTHCERHATAAYMLADAMLAARAARRED